MAKSRLDVYAEMLIDIDARLKAMEKGNPGKNGMRGKLPTIQNSDMQKSANVKRALASYIITKHQFDTMKAKLDDLGKQMNEINSTLKEINK